MGARADRARPRGIDSRPRCASAAASREGTLGLGIFGALALAGQWTGGGSPGWTGLPLAYPAVAAAPAAAAVLWMARRAVWR